MTDLQLDLFPATPEYLSSPFRPGDHNLALWQHEACRTDFKTVENLAALLQYDLDRALVRFNSYLAEMAEGNFEPCFASTAEAENFFDLPALRRAKAEADETLRLHLARHGDANAMPKAWTSRFVAYARSKDRTPEEQYAAPRKVGELACWLGRLWSAFKKENPEANPHSANTDGTFDRWLESVAE